MAPSRRTRTPAPMPSSIVCIMPGLPTRQTKARGARQARRDVRREATAGH